MENKIDREKPEKKYNGVSNIPFPNASPSIKQREEQAFYEANSADGSSVFDKFWVSMKVIWKALKCKPKV